MLTDELRNVAIQSAPRAPPAFRPPSTKNRKPRRTGITTTSSCRISRYGRNTSPPPAPAPPAATPRKQPSSLRTSLGAPGPVSLGLREHGRLRLDDRPCPSHRLRRDGLPHQWHGPVTVSFQGHASGAQEGSTSTGTSGWQDRQRGESEPYYKAGGNFTWKLTVTDAADKRAKRPGPSPSSAH